MGSISQNKLQIRKKAENQYEALAGADALIITIEWSEFRNPYFELKENSRKYIVVFDGRNLFDVVKMKELGNNYETICRIIN